MKIGVCTGFENLEKAAAFGFDYIEVGVGSVAGLSDEEYSALKSRMEEAPIKVEAANVMLPGSIKLTGDEADHEKMRQYLEKAYARLSGIGCQTVVFGSGGARNIPEGFDRGEAMKQLLAASCIIGDTAQKYGITIALEPLCRKECNVINSVSEGGELVEKVKHPSFCLLADYYHIGMEGEDFDGILRYGKYLRHTHIAHPVVRSVPAEGDGGRYEGFFAALKEIGYSARVSIEARVNDFDKEMPEALVYLKKLAR
ncbi:MAG: sugar phosphate isomerase/epimerase [Clostridia bacterium]|nr:sugar phosphate isomerase/epimerase [Clostridia bacterium]